MNDGLTAVITVLASTLSAVIVGTLGYLGVRHSLRVQERTAEVSRVEEAERLLRKYRDPLVRAAFDLQSRCYNIAAHDFLGKYTSGTPGEREYAHESTLYVVAEYFAWVEIMRREVQFLDLRDAARNRALAERLEEISRAFLAERADTTLRVFRGEQRALGEVMIADDGGGERECIGYAAFVARRADPAFARWFEKLSADVTALTVEPRVHEARLVEVQHALIALIDFLDPTYQYFPAERRRPIATPTAA